MTNLLREKYVRLTTFTKDGRPKHTPVWIAELDGGRVGTTTDDDSWKVKRLRNTNAIELAASDSRGNVAEGVEILAGSAAIIDCSQADYIALESAMIEKYGLIYRLFRFIRKIRGKRPCGIEMTL